MDAPSYDEWLDIIRQLPNGKATGPSGMSNEMLKHLSDDCNHFDYETKLFQDSIDNNNELWILSQDMGKAYDRVNIFQLKKAMDRIKIPNDFSSLILELFKDRKNQVITAYGKTAPYDVLTGIDQGEVISPLLWCIYYDPLLAEIDKQQLGYNISCISTSVVQEDGVLNQQNVSVMAYMDDTQWITDEKSKLEKMLYIADTFYRLNDIQYQQRKFGCEEINIKAKYPHEPMRILGVIIVPRVEYWSQVMALSKTQTEALIIPFRRMFKNKLKFTRSAPNAILDNPYIYGYRDFYDNQLQAKITDFCIQLNDNDKIFFQQLKGGQIPLEDVVDNAYYSNIGRGFVKEYFILDQIVSSDKSRLLLWKEILIKAYVPISSQQKEAKWYLILGL
ncbi:unnamed protein product [Rhizophagus irregularis]|nr:unnamed protein product [Rhizophagus irregularis]